MKLPVCVSKFLHCSNTCKTFLEIQIYVSGCSKGEHKAEAPSYAHASVSKEPTVVLLVPFWFLNIFKSVPCFVFQCFFLYMLIFLYTIEQNMTDLNWCTYCDNAISQSSVSCRIFLRDGNKSTNQNIYKDTLYCSENASFRYFTFFE